MEWCRAFSLTFCGSITLAIASLHCSWAEGPPISITSDVPQDLNPGGGGAPSASYAQAAAFAWQEFIALNWPAGPQEGKPDQRDAPSTTYKFGDPTYSGPLVWETFRGKVETFPGAGDPPGYDASDARFGYDALPVYNYGKPVRACDASQANDPTPWVNLDETDQILLDNMYAGIVDPSSSPGNSSPQLIRFLAKSNFNEYHYVADNKWWNKIPDSVTYLTVKKLLQTKRSPDAGSKDFVSLPNNTIEVKAGWRVLNPAEVASGQFHTQTVRFYEKENSQAAGTSLADVTPCYRDATWGLVSLHIIQKTKSAPYFIFATFEQAFNIRDHAGQPTEDQTGNQVGVALPISTFPQVCLKDPKPVSSTSAQGASPLASVIMTDDPKTCQPAVLQYYCDDPGGQLYYHNEAPINFDNPTGPKPPVMAPIGGKICVVQRANPIPDYVKEANLDAFTSMYSYSRINGIDDHKIPWFYYKLVNVQFYPYDKIPDASVANGSPYSASPPYTAANPPASSYYQANIMLETNRSLQMFAGGLSPSFIASEWFADGSPVKNVYYDGKAYNMGGCMGCHGFGAQVKPNQTGDFSFILEDGAVTVPEIPAIPDNSGMLTVVPRNRHSLW